jgi:hypothetical protein
MIRIEGIPVVMARLRSLVRMTKGLPSVSVQKRSRVGSRPLNWRARPISGSLWPRLESPADLASWKVI